MSDTKKDVAIHPAATVLLLRDTGDDAIELLYLRRNAALAFHGGAWVYPGGRIDAEDFAGAPEDLDAAARRAAVREAEEEAGVYVDPESLVHFAEWTTPTIRPKRFRTWFFAAPATTCEVAVDGGEIHAFRWMRPGEALEAHAAGEIELPGPTFVTSHWLRDQPNVEEALAALGQDPVPRYLPHTRKIEGGLVSLLPEDAAFAGGELEVPGPRHRIYMIEGAWRYERSDPSDPRRPHRPHRPDWDLSRQRRSRTSAHYNAVHGNSRIRLWIDRRSPRRQRGQSLFQ